MGHCLPMYIGGSRFSHSAFFYAVYEYDVQRGPASCLSKLTHHRFDLTDDVEEGKEDPLISDGSWDRGKGGQNLAIRSRGFFGGFLIKITLQRAIRVCGQ